jgi:alkyl sulfatase BDS1-like metallo-beta-lactamase superfamily hydrolase
MTRASRATAEANAFVRTSLPFDDATDFALATRGFVAPLPEAVETADGRPVWDAHRFDFIDGEAPDSVKR